MSVLETVKITDGDLKMVVNKIDFEAGQYDGFEIVGSEKQKSEKTEAEKIAKLTVEKLVEAIDGFDADGLIEVLEAEKADRDRTTAVEAIEQAIEDLGDE